MSERAVPIRMIVREIEADGTVLDTEYAAEPIPTEQDPFVRSRLVPRGRAAGSEIITEFAPASVRPVSYPAALPFIADREVWTTESPAGTRLEGARWPCVYTEALLNAIVEASIADGWRVIPHPPGNQLLGNPDVVLQRGSLFRELQVVRLADNGIIQLWDVPDTWFDSRPANDAVS